MSRRELDIQPFAACVPLLLESIAATSGVHAAEMYRRLALQRGIEPGAVKRNWLRWRQVKPLADYQGRLPRADSLSGVVAAASSLGWLDRSPTSGFAPLLAELDRLESQRWKELNKAAMRRHRVVREVIRDQLRMQLATHFDDVTWFVTLNRIVAETLVEGLRARLFKLDSSGAPSSSIRDDLLAGALSAKIHKVCEAGAQPLLTLAAEAERLEANEQAAFKDVVAEAGFLDEA